MSIEKSTSEREDKQQRIIELRKDNEDNNPSTPFNSCEDFSEIAKEVKTNLVNSLSEKLKGLQPITTNNNTNKLEKQENK